MQNIQNQISLYHSLFYACLVLMIFFLVCSILLFFVFDIKTNIALRLGIEKKSSAKKINKANSKTDKLKSQIDMDYTTSSLNEEKNKSGKLKSGKMNSGKINSGRTVTERTTERIDETSKLADAENIGRVENLAMVKNPANAVNSAGAENPVLSETGLGAEKIADTEKTSGTENSNAENLTGFENSPGVNDTVLLNAETDSQLVTGSLETEKPQGFMFKITENIMVIHTNELI